MRPNVTTCSFLCALLILGGCATTRSLNSISLADDPEAGEMGGQAISERTDLLYVDPALASMKRAEFKSALKASGQKTASKRELYGTYIDAIGANGLLDVIQEVWPKCHSEGHAAGALIESRLRNIGESLSVCADTCYSGCMHGVLMEAFKSTENAADPDAHVELSDVKALMDTVCFGTNAMSDSYSPGDCAHGVGHALMFLADYDTEEAIDYCKAFDQETMTYYCATGAYMEYVTERDSEDALSKPPLFPCDRGEYPAACARYKFVHLVGRFYKSNRDAGILIRYCTSLTGKYRIGCFHGLGNGHMGLLYYGKIGLGALCLKGTEDDNRACIEGAMERMQKYHPERATELCGTLSGGPKANCDDALRNGMYSMEKDMSLYLR